MSDETFTQPGADRAPTPDEARAAERGAADVDVDRVGEHYRAEAERGADVAGEGRIDGVPADGVDAD